MNSISSDMDFEELKNRWNNVAVKAKSHEDLMEMTHMSHHPRLRKLRKKLIIEISISVVIMILILLVTWLRSVSPWIATGLIISNGFFLINNILGFHYLHVLPQSDTILDTLSKYHQRMKRMLELSYLAGSIMIAFLIFADIFLLDGRGQRFTFSFFLAPLTFLSFWATDKWRSRTIEVRKMLRDLEQ